MTRMLLFSVPPQTTVPEAFLHNLSDEDMAQCAVDLRLAAEERVEEMLRRDHGVSIMTQFICRSGDGEGQQGSGEAKGTGKLFKGTGKLFKGKAAHGAA